MNQKDAKARITHQDKLKNIYKDSSNSHNTMLIISNTNIKNNITTVVLHIQREYEIIIKTIHHTINIMFTRAMRYSISQVFQAQDIIYIAVIINVILATKRIFDMFLHLYQLYFITISSDLRKFFNKNFNNTISF